MITYGLLLFSGSAGFGAAGSQGGYNPFDLSGPQFLMFFLLFSVAVFAVAGYKRSRIGAETARFGEDEQLDAYALAELADGHGQAFVAALVSLHQNGHVVLKKDEIARGPVPLPLGRPVLERAIVSGIIDDGTATTTVRASAKDALDSIAAGLAERGLVLPPDSTAHLPALGIACIVPVVGIGKIMIGLARDKPVGLLVVMVFFSAFVVGIFFRRLRVTRKGRDFLERVRAKHGNLSVGRAVSPAELPLAVGLFGLGVLETTELKDVVPHLSRVPAGSGARGTSCGTSACSSHSSSSSGGGGCGGDSGGGGGGCGGCGGGGD